MNRLRSFYSPYTSTLLKNLFSTEASTRQSRITSLLQTLKPSSLEVVDQTQGCGGRVLIFIASEQFRGKPRVSQHRMVQKLIEEEVKDVHALELYTALPDQPETPK
jgi:stress-induced morphogen